MLHAYKSTHKNVTRLINRSVSLETEYVVAGARQFQPVVMDHVGRDDYPLYTEFFAHIGAITIILPVPSGGFFTRHSLALLWKNWGAFAEACDHDRNLRARMTDHMSSASIKIMPNSMYLEKYLTRTVNLEAIDLILRGAWDEEAEEDNE
jgi:hypothetical protein